MGRRVFKNMAGAKWCVIRKHTGYLITGSAVAAAADLIIQTAHDHRSIKGVNRERLLQMTACGALINGVAVPAWLGLMQRKWGSNFLPKLMCDQGVFAPSHTTTWIGAAALQEGEEIWPRLKSKLLGLWAFDACFWVPWSAIMYKYVPLPAQ